MNPDYFYIVRDWINQNDIYIALSGMLILSVIGLGFVVHMYLESTFGILFSEDDE